MTIDLGPELEAMLASLAEERGVTPEAFAVELLDQRIRAKVELREPRDDWERRLRAIGVDCGVSLSNETLSREEMYD